MKGEQSTFLSHTFFARRSAFLGMFAFVLGISYVALSAVGWVPEQNGGVNSAEGGAVKTASASAEFSAPPSPSLTEMGSGPGEDVVPARVVIESVGIDVAIENPESRDIAVLDRALLQGAVHYPGSGGLEENSNMFLFGHSSYLPVVNNQSFRAFNGLEKVERGDVIRVESSDMVNLYLVESVELVDADEALVELSNREKKLTLSTCNSFGDPGERYVVEASFAGSYRI